MEYKSIALDGPSGAGKSTLAKRLAEELGFLYVDTGAIYRTAGLYAQRKGIAPSEAQKIAEFLPVLHITLSHGDDHRQHMYLDGEDVSDLIRRHEISQYAAAVSAVPAVRAFLLEQQRALAQNHHVVMDGRDIGTVVLPHADVKIFLTASPEARARRRFDELRERGQDVSYETVLRDILARDEADTTRADAPLKQADDAVLIDTTEINLDAALARLMQTVRERLP
ncbi:MAG: (d)CMP kinase [Oscillospiraceae bacterium]|nr:(d)CMP kinase [Oscillospiraceae bacterium]